MNKKRFAAALCAALLAAAPVLADSPLDKEKRQEQLAGEAVKNAIGAMIGKEQAQAMQEVMARLFAPFFNSIISTVETGQIEAPLPGIEKIESCENLEQLTDVLRSEGWKITTEDKVTYAIKSESYKRMVDGTEETHTTYTQYSLDSDSRIVSYDTHSSGANALSFFGVSGIKKPISAPYEFGRYREIFKGKLEAAAAKKLEKFNWQLEGGDIEAILDKLLSDKEAKHRTTRDGIERVTSEIKIDGFKCLETVTLDRKNNTAKVTVICDPLRLAKNVAPENLEEAKKRADDTAAEEKKYERQRAAERMFVELLQKAYAGDLGAIRQLAGQSLAANDEAGALGWYRKAVELGHTEVADEVAERLLTGRGFAKAPQKALEWYRLAYEKGNKAIPLKLAEMYRKGEGFAKNEEKAAEWYATAYKDGDKSLAQKLAEMYRKGDGFAKNEEKAAEWYATAYKDGSKNVKMSLAKKLAEMYLRGDGFAKSEENALKWYETAYKDGDRSLAPKLAEMYLRGDGFAKNEENALKWYETAYKAGNKSLAQKLAEMYLRGDGFAKNEENALKWYETAYKDGYRTVAYKLAEMYRKGDGFAKSEANALKWYETAYRGDSSVAAKLAELYLRGDGIAKSEDKALEWYRKAVETNDKAIALAVARRLRKGDGFAANIGKAIEWYSLAADKGLTEAAREAAEMYRFGRDVTKDEDAALGWYRRLVDIQGERDEEKLYQWQLSRGRYILEPAKPKSESAATARQIADDLLNGKDFTPSEEKAREWYLIAYRSGDTEIVDLFRRRADQYRNGNSSAKIKQDNALALEWYQKWVDATEDTDRKIDHIRDVAYWLQRGSGFKADGKASVEWYQKAIAVGGDGAGTKDIADLYRDGRPNLPQSNATALEWYQKWVDATEEADKKVDHIRDVAYWLQRGSGFKADGKASVEWYQKAIAVSGDGAGAKDIADLYRDGRPNLPQSNAKALEWYQKWVDATEDADKKVDHIRDVAYWLQRGNGFKADSKAAVEWYQKAVNLGDKDAAKQIEKLRKRKQ